MEVVEIVIDLVLQEFVGADEGVVDPGMDAQFGLLGRPPLQLLLVLEVV